MDARQLGCLMTDLRRSVTASLVSLSAISLAIFAALACMGYFIPVSSWVATLLFCSLSVIITHSALRRWPRNLSKAWWAAPGLTLVLFSATVLASGAGGVGLLASASIAIGPLRLWALAWRIYEWILRRIAVVEETHAGSV